MRRSSPTARDPVCCKPRRNPLTGRRNPSVECCP
jgi:hypothetical protein